VKILIADDNRLMLEGFRRALEQVRDIEIAGVTDCGAEVLGLVERRRPDVVALELGLRTRDGRSCLEALRAEHPHVKVVVLSASATPEIIRAAVDEDAEIDEPVVVEIPDESTGSNSVEFVEIDPPGRRKQRGRVVYPTTVEGVEEATMEEMAMSPVNGGALQDFDDPDLVEDTPRARNARKPAAKSKATKKPAKKTKAPVKKKATKPVTKKKPAAKKKPAPKKKPAAKAKVAKPKKKAAAKKRR